jgi:hypothetical protein
MAIICVAAFSYFSIVSVFRQVLCILGGRRFQGGETEWLERKAKLGATSIEMGCKVCHEREMLSGKHLTMSLQRSKAVFALNWITLDAKLLVEWRLH